MTRRFLNRRSLPLLVGCLGATLSARPPQNAQQPTFRSGIDVVQLDVSVLDSARHPVRGLAQSEFTVLEDGQPRPIVAFDAVDVPDAPPPPARWMSAVTPDVTSNSLDDRRLFVIVVDDALTPFDPKMMQNAKNIALQLIDRLGPHDLASMVFTADNRNAQDFTSDHAKLTKALDRFHAGLATYKFGLDSGQAVNTDTTFYQFTISTLHAVADYLIDVPQRRKTLVYIGPGPPVDVEMASTPTLAAGVGKGMPDKITMENLVHEMGEIFRQAQRANVAISTVDPTGNSLEAFIQQQLSMGGVRLPIDQAMDLAHKSAKAANDFVEAAAANTGGHAIVNTEDFGAGITQIFEENGSYYLLGFQPAVARTDGSLHRVEVKVNRPGVEVRTRSGYYAPTAGGSKSKAPPSALSKAIAGLLPDASLPMHVVLAPFVVPGSASQTVAVVLGIQQEAGAPTRDRRTETVELQVSAFTPEGAARGSKRQNAQVVLRAGATGEVRFEVLSRIDLNPGRYQIRLAAHDTSADKSGSVYGDVEVPDFNSADMSLSGLALSVSPALASAPKDGVAPVLPIVPTAEREFLASNKVTAFARVYESNRRAATPVALAIRITDEHDRVVFERPQTIAADRFGGAVDSAADAAPAPIGRSGVDARRGSPAPPPAPGTDPGPRAAEVRFEIPLERLGPGAHLLTFEATSGRVVARRDVRFVVK